MSTSMFFENERIAPSDVGATGGIDCEMDDCYSASFLYDDDPAPWSDGLGLEVCEPCPQVLRKFFSASKWMYKTDFDADEATQEVASENHSPTSKVRFRWWTLLPLDHQEPGQHYKSAVDFAFNLTTIFDALQKVRSVSCTTGRRSSASVVTARPGTMTVVGLEPDPLYDTFIVTEYRSLTRKGGVAGGANGTGPRKRNSSSASDSLSVTAAAAAAASSQTNNVASASASVSVSVPEGVRKSWRITKHVASSEYCVPVMTSNSGDNGAEASQAASGADIDIDPSTFVSNMHKWNILVDAGTDPAGWQFAAEKDSPEAEWKASRDLVGMPSGFQFNAKRRQWCMLYVKNARDIPPVLTALADYFQSRPRETILTCDHMKQGHVGHRLALFNTWKKRRFVLAHDKLAYYAGSVPKNKLPLTGYEIVVDIPSAEPYVSQNGTLTLNHGLEIVFPGRVFGGVPLGRQSFTGAVQAESARVSLAGAVPKPGPQKAVAQNSNTNLLLMDSLNQVDKELFRDALSHQLFILQLIARYRSHHRGGVVVTAADKERDRVLVAAHQADPSNFFNLFHGSGPPAEFDEPVVAGEGRFQCSRRAVGVDSLPPRFSSFGPLKRDSSVVSGGVGRLSIAGRDTYAACQTLATSDNGVTSCPPSLPVSAASSLNEPPRSQPPVKQLTALEEAASSGLIEDGVICEKSASGDWGYKSRYVLVVCAEAKESGQSSEETMAEWQIMWAKSTAVENVALAKSVSLRSLKSVEFVNGRGSPSPVRTTHVRLQLSKGANATDMIINLKFFNLIAAGVYHRCLYEIMTFYAGSSAGSSRINNLA